MKGPTGPAPGDALLGDALLGDALVGDALVVEAVAPDAEPKRQASPGRWWRRMLKRMEAAAVETAEQKIETALRTQFDLDGSRDASRAAARVLRMVLDGAGRPALMQDLRQTQRRWRGRIDEAACGRVAQIVLEVAEGARRVPRVN